jgi:hypothetical protein
MLSRGGNSSGLEVSVENAPAVACSRYSPLRAAVRCHCCFVPRYVQELSCSANASWHLSPCSLRTLLAAPPPWQPATPRARNKQHHAAPHILSCLLLLPVVASSLPPCPPYFSLRHLPLSPRIPIAPPTMPPPPLLLMTQTIHSSPASSASPSRIAKSMYAPFIRHIPLHSFIVEFCAN